jgi:four helix bundle protein
LLIASETGRFAAGVPHAIADGMNADDLKRRTKKFAVEVILFAKTIPKDFINEEIASQLARAAASTAAYYRAVCRAKSRADFIHKLGGAIEEVDESALWLEVLTETRIASRQQTAVLWQEADELTRIFVRSRETARANRDAAQQEKSKNRKSRINNDSSNQ